MTTQRVRLGPSGRRIGAGSEWWDEIPIPQGVVDGDSTLGQSPLVNISTPAAQVGGLFASIPEPAVPQGLRPQIIDLEQVLGGPANDPRTYVPSFLIFADDGLAGGGAPSGTTRTEIHSDPLSGDGRFAVLASAGTLIAGQDLPFDFPDNGSALTVLFGVDVTPGGYPANVWQWRFRVKWRLVSEL